MSTLSQAERIRRELNREFNDFELFMEFRAMVTRGEETKLIKTILDRYHDLMIEQLATTGDLNISRVIRVRTVPNKSWDFGRDDTSIPHRLEAKISETVKVLHKASFHGFLVDRDNWKKVFKTIAKNKKENRLRGSELYNPMIDEQDDENA